jgi:parallel beta-helix repeat protein
LYNTISGNVCSDNTAHGINLSGVSVSEPDSNLISGNVCEGNGSYGIRIAASGADRNVVTGNRATNNTSGNYSDSGTNTTNSGNDFN